MNDKKVRVRFAPSPTGPLHIGGIRTALYNYVFAKQNKGDFILRIEDTDQTRYVPGAENYIIKALEWVGLIPDEGPETGGQYGPYRQSERMSMYKKYAEDLLASNFAYYAFDSTEELEKLRENDPAFKYDASTRITLKNSLTLTKEEVNVLINLGKPYVIRMKVEKDQEIDIHDAIRGKVTFQSNELDDKVILKGDGMPTYHLANIVDDHLMEITHVIRGEEWLPSTAHHVLLYQYFEWAAPEFAHLPLILKPTGQGKLSKRDGAKFGFPVFPLQWDGGDEVFNGFREEGFLPEAVINFLGLVGWSPGNEEEIFSIDDFISQFSIEKIHKAGARFDYDKAKWFNQHYIIVSPNDTLASLIVQEVHIKYGNTFDLPYISEVCNLMKERVHLLSEIITQGSFFFSEVLSYDLETASKKWKITNKEHFFAISDIISLCEMNAETLVKNYIQDNQLKMGEILPILRIAISGSMQGPDLFESMFLLGNKASAIRIQKALPIFEDSSFSV